MTPEDRDDCRIRHYVVEDYALEIFQLKALVDLHASAKPAGYAIVARDHSSTVESAVNWLFLGSWVKLRSTMVVLLSLLAKTRIGIRPTVHLSSASALPRSAEGARPPAFSPDAALHVLEGAHRA